MGVSAILFYSLSGFILVTGLLAVTSRKIFRAAIWLLFSLIGIAGLYFWMQMEFIAAVQVTVYVGGIVVLIIFSIFLTQQSGQQMLKPFRFRVRISLLAVLSGFALTYQFIYRYRFVPTSHIPIDVRVANIGSQMLGTSAHGYALPFELVSVLLLAAMIGCIVIAIKINPAKK